MPGVINRNEYGGGERLIALQDALNHAGAGHLFSDEEIIAPVSALHCVSTLPPCPDLSREDAGLRVMQQQRYQQVVRSTMVLSLTTLISLLSLQQACKK